MGKTTGFMEFDRKDENYAPVKERIKNYKEFTIVTFKRFHIFLSIIDNDF